MSTALVGDNPQAYLPGDRRRALAADTDLPRRSTGCVLLADVSGFTPLTEALAAELGPMRGAEELAAVLDAVIGDLLGVLHSYGGSAVYFSGDAITCWLDGDDGGAGARCGLAMLERMSEVGARATPEGRRIQLALKVALDVGSVERFVVGDPAIQLIDVLAGSLMDSVADAERHALPGQVVLAAGAVRALGGIARLGPGDWPVLLEMPTDGDRSRAELEFPPLATEVVRRWLLPAVWERMSAGQGEMLADLRSATPLFLRFAGFDVDHDPRAPAQLDAFVVAAQRVVHAHGGNVLQLTIGDKGASLYAVFGAPATQGDDPARACAAALDLLRLDRTTAARDLQVGIARGRLRSGTYGHAERRTFCCLGDAVNVAARLMMAAPPGTAYATAAVEHGAAGAVRTRRLEPLHVKGKARPLELVQLIGPGDERSRAEAGSRLPFVGRVPELRSLSSLVDRAAAGRGRVVVIEGDPGIGKSRLISQLLDGVGDRFTLATGRARATPLYSGWRELVAGLLTIDPDGPRLAAQLEVALSELDPALPARAPLLGPLFGVELPDTTLTEGLDPRLRKASLEALVVRCIEALASRGPLLLLLEDAHQLEQLGRDLLGVVRRAVATLPVLVLVATRPSAGETPLVSPGRSVTSLNLRELDDGSVQALAAAKVRALGVAALSPALQALVADRGGGNPFYVEELLSYVHERGLDPGAEGLSNADLPEDLQSLVLSRVDALPEQPRQVIKVASVVGTRFAPPVLVGTYPPLGAEAQVSATLDVLTGMALTMGPDDDALHHFRHALTGEVTYESLPHATRTELHGRVARWLEGRHADDLDRVLDTLALHYGRSNDEPKKREYLVRAGIAAQAAYANAAAEDHLERALPLVADADRVDLLLRLGQLRELRGGWAQAEAGYLEAEALAPDRVGRAWCLVAAADVARREGNFDVAQQRLDAAREGFEADDDRSGLARVLHLEGTLSSQQGHYEAARDRYSASLQLRLQQGDRAAEGGLLSNLALVAECLGEYAAAEELNSRALGVRIDIRDRPGVAVSHNNLGMLAQLAGRLADARDHFARSMTIATEIGDRWVVAVGQHNLGNVNRDDGDDESARESYRAAYLFYADADDRWSIALLLEDLAQLAARTDAHTDALRLLGAADRLRGELAAPRAPALATELSAALAPSRAALGTDGEAVVQSGREASEDAVRSAVLALCVGRTPFES